MRVIAALKAQPSRLTFNTKLKDIPFVGEKIRDKVEEFLERGSIAEAGVLSLSYSSKVLRIDNSLLHPRISRVSRIGAVPDVGGVDKYTWYRSDEGKRSVRPWYQDTGRLRQAVRCHRARWVRLSFDSH